MLILVELVDHERRSKEFAKEGANTNCCDTNLPIMEQIKELFGFDQNDSQKIIHGLLFQEVVSNLINEGYHKKDLLTILQFPANTKL